MGFPLLPPRPRDSHKGMFGHVGIVGGAPGMAGAALLAGRAALKCGAGRVTLGLLDERVVVDAAQPELMFASPEHLAKDGRLRVLAIGPGLGQSERAQALLGKALAIPCPIVVDADGLNLLAAHHEVRELLRNRAHATLLTPHPGEAARLLGLGVNDVQTDRQDAARKIAAAFRAMVVLKGAASVVARPDGTVSVNSSGCPAMAAAGMGDVLTGLIAGLIAQGVEPGLALESGVYLHGVAGEQAWESQKRPPSICATDLIEAMPQLLSTSGS
jgi:ADP-dependent NAD(P)H-hydrate dehydratase / NAD(P)H-hydrate epimerase